MKTLDILALTAVMACATEKPTVGVYMVREYDAESTTPDMAELILEISNPTDKTF